MPQDSRENNVRGVKQGERKCPERREYDTLVTPLPFRRSTPARMTWALAEMRAASPLATLAAAWRVATSTSRPRLFTGSRVEAQGSTKRPAEESTARPAEGSTERQAKFGFDDCFIGNALIYGTSYMASTILGLPENF